jgi:hypothetical protein
MLLFLYIFLRAPEGLLTTAVPAQPGDDASQLGVSLLRERNEMSTVSWQAVFAVEKSARPKVVAGTDCGMSAWRIEQYEI